MWGFDLCVLLHSQPNNQYTQRIPNLSPPWDLDTGFLGANVQVLWETSRMNNVFV